MSQNENKPLSAEPVSGVLRRSEARLFAGDAQAHVPDTAPVPGDATGKVSSEVPANGAEAPQHGPAKR